MLSTRNKKPTLNIKTQIDTSKGIGEKKVKRWRSLYHANTNQKKFEIVALQDSGAFISLGLSKPMMSRALLLIQIKHIGKIKS